MTLVTGAHLTTSDSADHLSPIEQGLEYLKPEQDGIGLVKEIGIGAPVKSSKHTWTEDALPVRSETITVADGTTTDIDVVDANVYKAGMILRVENEFMRVTGRTDSNTIAVTRAYNGSTGAAHTAKTMINLGIAGKEKSTGPEASTTSAVSVYNYVEMFEDAIELSEREIAELTTAGNQMTHQLAIKTVHYWQLIANAVFNGKRGLDTTTESGNPIYLTGGLKYFLTSNPTSVGGAISKSAINSELLQLVEAGVTKSNLVIVCHPYQKEKVDSLDADKVRVDYGTKEAGTQDIEFYKSGVAGKIPIFSDLTVAKDEFYIIDKSKLKIRPLVNNGINGRANVVDATEKGSTVQRKILRGYYVVEYKLEKSGTYLYGLT